MIGNLNIKYNMEEWKQVPGYEAYELSNLGNIRRWNLAKTKARQILARSFRNNDYLMFTVSKDAKATKVYLHRMLAQLFVPNDNPKEKPDVCFLDNNRANVTIENLYWSNQKERMGRRKAEGKYDIKGNAKLTKIDVATIRWMRHHKAATYKELAVYYGVHPWTIYACTNGITWKSVK
jgi:hypothetical protein